MIFTAPQQPVFTGAPSVFLAGTIDMGNSENWQQQVGTYCTAMGFDVFNPRRDSWNADWKQESENKQLVDQIKWELTMLKKADVILLVLLPDSKSPITLLELGLFAREGKLMVCCPKEFYRSVNVKVTCNMFNIPCYETVAELLEELTTKFKIK